MDNYISALAGRGAIAGAAGMEQRNSYAPDACAARDTFSNVANDMENEAERLQKLYGMLEMIADRVDGTLPQQSMDGAKGLDTPPHSLLDNMRRKQRAISMTISRCETAAHRIAIALGL